MATINSLVNSVKLLSSEGVLLNKPFRYHNNILRIIDDIRGVPINRGDIFFLWNITDTLHLLWKSWIMSLIFFYTFIYY